MRCMPLRPLSSYLGVLEDCSMYIWGIWILCSLGTQSSDLDASRNMQWVRDAHAISNAIVTEISDRWQEKSHWEPKKYPHNQSPQPGGRTAFAVLALLSSGVPSQRKDVDAALTSLEGCELEGTYAIAARIMSFMANIWRSK